MSEIILQMKDIDKRFAGVHALKSVSLELKKGEVHALMGENGAGKSTLMKVLCGIHKRDGGEIELFGQKVDFSGKIWYTGLGETPIGKRRPYERSLRR